MKENMFHVSIIFRDADDFVVYGDCEIGEMYLNTIQEVIDYFESYFDFMIPFKLKLQYNEHELIVSPKCEEYKDIIRDVVALWGI